MDRKHIEGVYKMDNQILNTRPKTGYGFIYCYTSPSGKKYIGQTKTTLKERAKLNAKGYKGCTAFYNAIQKYGWDNFTVEILEEVPLDVLSETEIWYILDYDTINKEKGYNIIQERHDYLATLRHVPVYSYDETTGLFLEEYCSISEAERQMNVYRGTIRRVLNQLHHHVKNKVWMTQKFEKIPVIKNNVQSTSIKVYMYDSKTGDFLNKFDSIREASRQTYYGRSVIKDQINRKITKKDKKYTFRDFKVDNLYSGSSTTILNGVASSEAKEE